MERLQNGYVIELESCDRTWLRNFVTMAICFSINHGCVTAVLALVSSDFDKELAATSSAILYGTYTFSGLFASVPLVLILGAKSTLSLGLWSYCFYLTPFSIILLFPQLSDTVTTWLVIVGSLVGGFGAGLLWTAQGKYFATAAEKYAEDTGRLKEDINGYFGGIFSTIYVGCEVGMKLFSSIVWDKWTNGGKQFVFTFYAAAAVLSAIGMLCVPSLPQAPQAPKSSTTVGLFCKKLNDIRVVAKDVKIWMLGPLNFAFGFTSSYVGWYLNGKVGSLSVGIRNVGYLAAIIPGYAALAGVPYSYIGKYFGKWMVMLFGCLSFLYIGLVCTIVHPKTLIAGKWKTLIWLYLVAGNGRAVFESTNRAVFADFFPETIAGAFALSAVQSGLAPAFGFLVFTDSIHMNPVAAAKILVVMGGISCVTVPLAFYINKQAIFSAEKLSSLPH